MNKNIFDDVSILIIGFDGYKDVWDHCISLLNQYWKERPKTYLATSELAPDYNDVEIIPAGSGSEWSRKVQVALKEIDTPYVILLLEDFFISDYVNNDLVKEALELVQEDDIKFYQVLVQLLKQSWEKGAPYKENKHIHIVPRDKKYGINLQAAIWKTDFLREKVGTENYNAWLFEMNQLKTENYNVDKVEYLIDDRNILNITHAVVQSKYLRGAVKYMEKLGHHIDLSERPLLSKTENFKYNLKLFMYSATPKCLVKPAKAIGKLMKVDFVTDRLSKK